MARNDGIDRTFARNQDLPTLDDVAKVQEHNEREKDSYSNQDIDTTQTYRNIHFKAPTDSYAAMFDQLIADGIISTRGLKADAVKYGELIFDVNSAYFHNHGGYEYAKQFYTDAYKAAVEIVGGEQYILSAVMHADVRYCFYFCLFMGSVRGGSTRAGFVWALARPGAWKHSTALSAHPPQRKAEPDHSNHPAGRG